MTEITPIEELLADDLTEQAPRAAACRQHRSAVPDLLFEDIRDARVEDIRPYLEDPEDLDETAALHRVTVFLTYRCNLDCPYCKTIARTADELRTFPQKQITYT